MWRVLRQALPGFIVLGLVGWGAVELGKVLWRLFSEVNPTVGAGLIAASATVIVSVISVLLAKSIEHRSTLAKEHREKKIPFYEEFVAFTFQIVLGEKMGAPPLTEEKLVERTADFTQNLIVWGSNDVVRAWSDFRKVSQTSSGDASAIATEMGKLLIAIRTDLGHSNKGISPQTILSTFVNNI